MSLPKVYEGKVERGAASTLRALRAIGADVIAGKTVLDLGCNVGLVAAALVEEFGAGRVVGFEPHPAAFERARARGADVGFEVRNAAVMPHEGEVTIVTGSSDSKAGYYCNTTVKDSAAAPSSAETHRVPAVAFHEVLAELRPGGIKMDIEGSEYGLLLSTRLPSCVEWLCVEVHGLKSWGIPLLPFIHDRLTASGFGVTRWPARGDLNWKNDAPNAFHPFAEINYVRGAKTPEEHADFLNAVRAWYAERHPTATPKIRDASRRELLVSTYGGFA